MKANEKVAIARIFSDLIKADRIVDLGEMEYWESICSKYSFDRDIEIQSQNISFADALSIICKSDIKGLKHDLLEDCRSMTVSDGFCAHSDALIMIALIMIEHLLELMYYHLFLPYIPGRSRDFCIKRY